MFFVINHTWNNKHLHIFGGWIRCGSQAKILKNHAQLPARQTLSLIVDAQLCNQLLLRVLCLYFVFSDEFFANICLNFGGKYFTKLVLIWPIPVSHQRLKINNAVFVWCFCIFANPVTGSCMIPLKQRQTQVHRLPLESDIFHRPSGPDPLHTPRPIQ